MASTKDVLRPADDRADLRGKRDLSLDYLRTTLIMMVVADHSALPYTTADRFGWRNMILSDVSKSACFDYVVDFFDVFFMSLLFFISGLFVYPALQRRGATGFLRNRFLRLGIPFAFSVTLLLPFALYASWHLTGNAGFASLYALIPTRSLPVGPAWFLWELLFFDVVLVLSVMPFRRWMPRLLRLIPGLRSHALGTFVSFFLLSACAYLPLLHRCGYGSWTNLFDWPFAYQQARIGLYALWFLLGFFVGAPGLDSGLIANNGSLARHWPLWVLWCIFGFNALWLVPRWLRAHAIKVPHAGTLDGLLWVVSCTASCFAFLALFRGVKLPTLSWMKSLNRSAYVIYLVNYIFIAWWQFVVRNRPIGAGLKFLLVFLTTASLSWLTALLLLRIPMLRTIL